MTDTDQRWPPRKPPAPRDPDYFALGGAVRELRARLRISQEELGYRAHLHRNYVGAIERGEINPSFRILMKLIKGLDVPLSELVALYERHRQAGVSHLPRRTF